MEKLTKIKYLGQTTQLKDTTKEESRAKIRAAWSCFGKTTTRKYFKLDDSPYHNPPPPLSPPPKKKQTNKKTKTKQQQQTNKKQQQQKHQVMDQCVSPTMTYSCQTWYLDKQLTNLLKEQWRGKC